MADSTTVALLAWLDTLPAPKKDSQWDAIFLVPEGQLDFGIWLAWFHRTHLHPEGELRELFLTRRC